jgi:serine/threonine protein kinase
MYEFGTIISHGMIGIVYMARMTYEIGKPIRCIKLMFVEKIIEKKLTKSIYNELSILNELKSVLGVIELVDVHFCPQYIQFVFPYYSNGDLYKYLKSKKNGRLPEEDA